MTILKKSQFTDDGNGSFYKKFKAVPKDASLKVAKLEDGTVNHTSSDENVATTEENESDQLRFKLWWVNPGTVTVTTTGDSDLDPGEEKFVNGQAEFKLENDEAETVTIEEDND